MSSLYERIRNIESKQIISHTLITNGYLVNDGVLRFINHSNLNEIQVTLDGIREHHDVSRCLRHSQSPTYDRILHNIAVILKECPETNVSVRINVNRENSEDFFKMYSYLHDTHKSSKLFVYPGFIREDAPDHCSLCYDSMNDKAVYEFYKDLYTKGTNISFMPHVVRKKGCIMHQLNSFVIGPRGELYKCWNDVNNENRVVGYINEKTIKNRRLLYHLMNETHPFSDPSCKKCLQFPVCGGGCGWYRSRNVCEGGHFNLCSIYKDFTILEDALLCSIKREHKVKFNQKLQLQ